MWRWLGGGFAALCIAGGIYVLASGAVQFGINGGTCRQDNEIPADDRKSVDDAATGMVGAILANDRAGSYGRLTKELQAHASRGDFDKFIALTNVQFGPMHAPALGRTFLLDIAGAGPDGRTVCGQLSNNQWVSVVVRPGQRQAYAEVHAQSRNNGWDFVLWLLPEAGAWKVQDIHVNMSEMAGRSAGDLLAAARHERDAGHSFNAVMLFVGAQSLTGRGPVYQLGISQPIGDELKALQVPAEFQGRPPFAWTMIGKPFTVRQVTITGIGKDMGLVFALPHDRWTTNEDADAQNHAFLDAFRAEHPDYAPVFGFLVARAMKPDDSGGFATVYNNATGYAR
jgi:hypothetical protein